MKAIKMNEQGSVDAGNPDGGGQVANQTSSQQSPWYQEFPEDVRGLVETKGWQSPVDAIQSYTNLEKFLGADKANRGLVLPKDDATAEEWGQVYDKLGRPKDAAGYNLPVPDGTDGAFAQEAAGKFHELGLTSKQAQQLTEWFNDKSSGAMSDMQSQQAQSAEQQMSELQKEWGKEFDANIESGRRAARQFGVSEDMLNKMENALGTKDMLKFFSNVGKGVGEDSFVEGSGNGKFGMSPEAARVRVNSLKSDPNWTAKYLGGDADAKAELERLMRAGYPS
jgi:hypothetical protein